MRLILFILASFFCSSYAGMEPGISQNACVTDEDCGIPFIRVCNKNDISIGVDETGIIPNLRGVIGHCVTNFIPILGVLGLTIIILFICCFVCCCASCCRVSRESNQSPPIVLQTPSYHKI